MANSRCRAARWNTIAALIVLSPMFQMASAQFANNPFFDHAEALGIAHGIEMLDIRLAALAATDDPAEEEIEAAQRKDLPQFMGSLSGKDPSLALELEESLEGLLERVEDEDKGFEEAVQAAQELTSRARDLVVPANLLQTPPFSAALLTLILLAEEGVAERFEEAAEGEEEAYPGGWAALQRVEELWVGLEPIASDTQRFEVNDMLRSLNELFPSPELPDAFHLSDPEAAEDPAQRIAGFLEELADASLFPDRNLGQLILLTQELVQVGCEALKGGEEELGSQRLAIAGFYYAQYLGDTIGLLARDSHNSLRPLWQDFAEEAEESEGDEGKADCQELLDGLEQARASLGG